MLGKPKDAVTFKDYSRAFVRAVMRRFTAHGVDVDRVDVCFDRYREFSIKGGTRAKRIGKVKKTITCTMPRHDLRIPANWGAFLGLEDNKRNYVRYLAELLREHCQDDAGVLPAGDGGAGVLLLRAQCPWHRLCYQCCLAQTRLRTCTVMCSLTAECLHVSDT